MTCRSRRSHVESRAGITFVEVMFTVLIVAVGLIAVSAAFQTSVGALERSRAQLRSDAMARETADLVRLSVAETPREDRIVPPRITFDWFGDGDPRVAFVEQDRIEFRVFYSCAVELPRAGQGGVRGYTLPFSREERP